jgi:hypothetical protein
MNPDGVGLGLFFSMKICQRVIKGRLGCNQLKTRSGRVSQLRFIFEVNAMKLESDSEQQEVPFDFTAEATQGQHTGRFAADSNRL